MEVNAHRYVWRNAQQFAKAQFWYFSTWKRNFFSLSDLRNGTPRANIKQAMLERVGDNEHLHRAEYFRAVRGDTLFPVAIVAHPFGNDFERHRAWAESEGLRATLLPCSWRNPAGIGVLYTRPDTELHED